jgi:hypothetical protein
MVARLNKFLYRTFVIQTYFYISGPAPGPALGDGLIPSQPSRPLPPDSHVPLEGLASTGAAEAPDLCSAPAIVRPLDGLMRGHVQLTPESDGTLHTSNVAATLPSKHVGALTLPDADDSACMDQRKIIASQVSTETLEIMKQAANISNVGSEGALKQKPEPPQWYSQRALVVLAQVKKLANSHDLTKSHFALSTKSEDICPDTGYLLKPRLSTYLAADQCVRIFDLRMIKRGLIARGCCIGSHGDISLPCPYDKSYGSASPVHHLTHSTGKYSFRAFAADTADVHFALVAVERCGRCEVDFLHSNTVVLSMIPRIASRIFGISLEGNDGDPGVIVSDKVVEEARANDRMRQGPSNTEKKNHEAVGHRAARVALCYFEHGRSYYLSLQSRVGDFVWSDMNVQDQIRNIHNRAELLAFRAGARLENWPQTSPHTILASPPLTRYCTCTFCISFV